MNIERDISEQETADETSSDDALSDSDQDLGVGPIDGDEAIHDDTPFTHTPIPPTPR